MRIAGIDPGVSKVGYAVVDGGKVVEGGVLRWSSLREVYEFFLTLFSQVEWVGVEETVFPRNYRRTYEMGEISGVVKLAALNRGCKLLGISPSEVKETLAFDGLAAKDSVRLALKRLGYDWKCEEHDFWDALGVAFVTDVRIRGLR